MNASTAQNRFEGAQDRRRRLRRSSDREMHARLKRERGRCAEPGCEEDVWLDGRYCIWHPKLRLVRED